MSSIANNRPLRDTADIGRARENLRQRRLARLALWLAPVAAILLWRAVHAQPLIPWAAIPVVDPMYLITGVFFAVLIFSLLATSLVAGRSPHVTYRPEQITVRMDDVKGLGPIKEDVNRSVDLFLAGETFRRQMGGTPRRGLLFEGTPGTGKTFMAKAMAAEAGVPFLFVSATAFQSMYYGATARKIRSYFKQLRKTARREGGVIGFIEEIDAIAMVRNGMSMTAAPAMGMTGNYLPALGLQTNRMVSEGTGGVVNELLVQMQSFDEPTGWQKLQGKGIDALNLFLPAQRQVPKPKPEPVNVLLIAATNRADNLDPALMRPGRFDRRLTFDLPDKTGRREILDHYLARKSHCAELDDDERRDALAGVTQGFSPVMIENLLDEGLVNAVRRGSTEMNWKDLEHARMVVSVGLGQPVGYTAHEKRLIATHEAGHATIAWLEAPERRLEILTIIKRASALGLLAHGDAEDVYTRSKKELTALIRIALGGQVAEELFFGDVSTGPSGDLMYATETAAEMVGEAGMFGTLISYAAAGGSSFSDNSLVAKVLGNNEARAMVERLLQDQRWAVRELMDANRHLVEALRDALLERHELIGHEITDVLAEAAARRPVRRPAIGAARPGGSDLVIDLTETRTTTDA